MTVPHHSLMISLSHLCHELMLDPYYGLESNNLEATVQDILQERSEDRRFKEFYSKFQHWPCKKDRYRLLVYLWIGLGLPAYHRDQRVSWHFERDDSLEYWLIDFRIVKQELSDFLAQQCFPLPTGVYPDVSVAPRDRQLQKDANDLAREITKESGSKPAKRAVANQLAKSEKYKRMSSERIERIIRRQW